MSNCARTPPAAFARSSALFHGLSIKYPSFVSTAIQINFFAIEYVKRLTYWPLEGTHSVMTVCWSIVWPSWDKISEVKILIVLPVSVIISGSQGTLKTSPTIGSRTLNGRRTSSSFPFTNLRKRGLYRWEMNVVCSGRTQG